MKIISTNTGEARTIQWKNSEVSTGMYKHPTGEAIFLDKEDVANDTVVERKYHGGEDKACYIFSEKHYPYWKENYPDLDWDWGMFGENLTVSDFDESEIMIGDEYKIGEAVVQISQPRQPCYKLGIRFGSQDMVKQFIRQQHCGGYVRVIKQGEVKPGDKFVFKSKKKKSQSLREIFELLYSKCPELSKIKQALDNEFLAESCKRDLSKILERIKKK
jgi:MOSC domain-containing protein YiiM